MVRSSGHSNIEVDKDSGNGGVGGEARWRL